MAPEHQSVKHMEGPTYATVGGLSQDASAVQLSRESPFLPLMNSATVRVSHDAHLHACAGSFLPPRKASALSPQRSLAT